jgi:trehalose 6-phosphate synthase
VLTSSAVAQLMLRLVGMKRSWPLLTALVIGLGLLTGLADVLLHRTLRGWFERDLRLRSELALHGARRTLVSAWQRHAVTELRAALQELARDERIMAAAACDLRGNLFVHSEDYPLQFTCQHVAAKTMQRGEIPNLHHAVSLPRGRVYLSTVPLVEADEALGFAVLVHDLSYVDRREAVTRRALLLVFTVLAIAASALTLFAARWLFRGWAEALRRQLRGGAGEREFQPILSDVRGLIDRIAAERDRDRQEGTWTPERLKQVLRTYVHGERVILCANREPYIHERGGDGEVRVLHPASGLVTALEPVMRACSGVWVAHGNGSADRETADAQGRLRVPPDEESYWLRRVWLSDEEERGYYYGFANEGLWALCHLAHTRPEFRGQDFRHYHLVNQKFAAAVAEEADSDDPIILVQDYHFALAPMFIRGFVPRATILTFWHIPWPNAERFGICPWHRELLTGLLASSVVGFHTQAHCNNFLDAVDRYLEARIDRTRDAVICRGHTTLVRPYPISIAWPNPWAKTAPPVAACRLRVCQELGLPGDALIGLGVDRIDYTKGIEERLLAVERLLEVHPELIGRFTFVQLGAPSRTVIPRYQQLNDAVAALAERINSRFGKNGYKPIVFGRGHHEPPTIFRYYRAANFCYVSSLHDGMNLVAKEFVAAREDEQGVLVLSVFTGAAQELTEALIVNPYDLDQASAALYSALHMTAREQRVRMQTMRRLVGEFNIYRWAGRLLLDAARLRERDRLGEQLRQHGTVGDGSGQLE